jgi:hypothetical protein
MHLKQKVGPSNIIVIHYIVVSFPVFPMVIWFVMQCSLGHQMMEAPCSSSAHLSTNKTALVSDSEDNRYYVDFVQKYVTNNVL